MFPKTCFFKSIILFLIALASCKDSVIDYDDAGSGEETAKSEQGCHLVSRTIILEELGSLNSFDFDSILYPKSVDIGECVGHCNEGPDSEASPLPLYYQVMKALSPDSAPKICCGPVDLAPLLVLNTFGSKDLSITTLQGMIVKSCGCR